MTSIFLGLLIVALDSRPTCNNGKILGLRYKFTLIVVIDFMANLFFEIVR